MKLLKKVIAFCLVIIAIIMIHKYMSFFTSPSADLPRSENYTPVNSQYSYDALPNDKSRDVYERLKTAAYSTPQKEDEFYVLGTISKNEDVSQEEFYLGMKAFMDDNPDVFWLKFFSSSSWMDSSNIYSYTIISTYPSDELKTMKDALKSSLESFLNSVPAGLDQEELEKYAHDYLIDNCEYDYDALDENGELNPEYKSAHKVGTAYGALVDKKPVCSGYAKAYQLLLNRLGVDCVPVYGQGNSLDKINMRKGGTNHQWNAVKNGSDWLMTDVTWDDAEDKSKRYTYFNIPIEKMYEDHNAQEIDLSTFTYSPYIHLYTNDDCLFLPE